MLTSHSRASRFGVALLALAGACSTTDATMATGPAASLNQSEGRGVFQRYVAIGTSVSMGWRSDGVIAASQATSWPAQLAGMATRTLTQPYIDGTGCRSPLIAPLALLVRLSGEPALQDPATLSCSPLRSDVTLPVANVAINGALTSDALFTTPENSGDPLYSRVLEPLHTQVSSMIEQNPKLVSVELGAVEVLGARSGIAIPGVSMVPYAVWQPLYDQVLYNVQRVTKTAVLVGLISDVRSFPAFRTGNEIWLDRNEFTLVNIAVSADCNGSANMVFMPVKLGIALVAAAQLAAAHAGPYTFSCTAGGPLDQDLILTPAEVAVVNAQMAAMSAHIQAEAAQRGYAYFALGALYDRTDIKPAFSLSVTLGTPTPFGALMSLDGIHPSEAGAAVLAQAAAHALNVTYKLGIPE